MTPTSSVLSQYQRIVAELDAAYALTDSPAKDLAITALSLDAIAIDVRCWLPQACTVRLDWASDGMYIAAILDRSGRQLEFPHDAAEAAGMGGLGVYASNLTDPTATTRLVAVRGSNGPFEFSLS